MSSTNKYQPLPTSPPSPSSSPRSSTESTHRPLRASVQAEFDRPPPSWWKRVALVLGLVGMVWLTMRLGGMGRRQPQVIYASRYSDEFRYRPAASPVITEYLKDGRIRLRGASVGGVGVREEDIPKSAARKAAEEKERIEEARDAAKRKLGLKTGKRKRKITTEM